MNLILGYKPYNRVRSSSDRPVTAGFAASASGRASCSRTITIPPVHQPAALSCTDLTAPGSDTKNTQLADEIFTAHATHALLARQLSRRGSASASAAKRRVQEPYEYLIRGTAARVPGGGRGG